MSFEPTPKTTTKSRIRMLVKEADKGFDSGFCLLTTGRRHMFTMHGNFWRMGKGLKWLLENNDDFRSLVVLTLGDYMAEKGVIFEELFQDELSEEDV